MSGKGSKRRPTNEAAYAENWDRLFAGVDQGRQGADLAIPVDGAGYIAELDPDTGAITNVREDVTGIVLESSGGSCFVTEQDGRLVIHAHR